MVIAGKHVQVKYSDVEYLIQGNAGVTVNSLVLLQETRSIWNYGLIVVLSILHNMVDSSMLIQSCKTLKGLFKRLIINK